MALSREAECNVAHFWTSKKVYQFPQVGPFALGVDRYPCDIETAINGQDYLAFFIPGFGYCYVPKDRVTEIETYKIGEVYLDKNGKVWQLMDTSRGAIWRSPERNQFSKFRDLERCYGPMTRMIKAQPDGNMF